jgi:hypothetical protein
LDTLVTYSGQVDGDLPTRIDRGLLAAQLPDFAEDADGLVRELLQHGLGDAWRCF